MHFPPFPRCLLPMYDSTLNSLLLGRVVEVGLALGWLSGLG